MSLIPSESLNFPDGFRAKVGWRRSKQPQNQNPAASVFAKLSTLPQAEASLFSAPDAPAFWSGSSASAAESLPNTSATAQQAAVQLELLPDVVPVENKKSLVAADDQGTMAVETAGQLGATNEPLSDEPPPGFAAPNSDLLRQLFGGGIGMAPPAEMASPETSEAATNITAVPDDYPELDPVWAQARMRAEPPRPSPAPQPGEMVIETPAHAHQILEFIAAAVQRGSLAGEVVPPATTPRQRPISRSKPEDRPAAAPQPAAPPSEIRSRQITSPSPALARGTPVQKAPAKIRITPRKMKAKPAAEAAVDSPPPVASPARRDTASPAPCPQPVLHPVAENPPKRVPPQPVAAHPESRPALVTPHYPPARQIILPASRLEPKTDLFTQRERRNRWIIFGLAELFVIACLGFLGRVAFSYSVSDPTIKLLIYILAFVAAATAVVVPIVFIRNNPARWQPDR